MALGTIIVGSLKEQYKLIATLIFSIIWPSFRRCSISLKMAKICLGGYQDSRQVNPFTVWTVPRFLKLYTSSVRKTLRSELRFCLPRRKLGMTLDWSPSAESVSARDFPCVISHQPQPAIFYFRTTASLRHKKQTGSYQVQLLDSGWNWKDRHITALSAWISSRDGADKASSVSTSGSFWGKLISRSLFGIHVMIYLVILIFTPAYREGLVAQKAS